jgi:hypothetical protein
MASYNLRYVKGGDAVAEANGARSSDYQPQIKKQSSEDIPIQSQQKKAVEKVFSKDKHICFALPFVAYI